MTDDLSYLGVPDQAVTLRFIRSGGPGGQNVNKLATAVQLQCDLNATHLSEPVKARLRTLAGRRLSGEDVLTLTAQRFRTQEHNKRDAFERLQALLEEARIVPKPRRATKPTRSSQRKRLENNQQRGEQKALRRWVGANDT
jgi:ribosome-associated protein